MWFEGVPGIPERGQEEDQVAQGSQGGQPTLPTILGALGLVSPELALTWAPWSSPQTTARSFVHNVAVSGLFQGQGGSRQGVWGARRRPRRLPKWLQRASKKL